MKLVALILDMVDITFPLSQKVLLDEAVLDHGNNQKAKGPVSTQNTQMFIYFHKQKSIYFYFGNISVLIIWLCAHQ